MMPSKVERLKTIKSIISKEKIETQDELLGRLKDKGYVVTQATLSRDLNELKVAKIKDSSDKSIYVLPEKIISSTPVPSSPKNALDGFISLELSKNIGVIKTIPAFSHTIASAIDYANIPEVLGTLAGNDIVIIVFAEDVTHEQAVGALKRDLPAFKEYI